MGNSAADNAISSGKNGQFVFKQEDSVEHDIDHPLVFQGDEVRISDMIASLKKCHGMRWSLTSTTIEQTIKNWSYLHKDKEEK